MGLTWLVIYILTHKWLFESGSTFRLGSRKEEFVDKLGVLDTLIEKVRFTLKHLPVWMLPVGYDQEKHATFMRVVNPENGNAFIGESANSNFGSGGRSTAIMLDEYAKWDSGIDVNAWTSTADVTGCRIVISTPYGSGNKFAMLASGTHEKIKKLTFHWSLHPDKGKESYYLDGVKRIPIIDCNQAFNMFKAGVNVRSVWYDFECERRSEADVAQELDIDYLKSGYPFFQIKQLVKQRQWEHMTRRHPADEIPNGNYITVDLVRTDYKVELREHHNGWLRIYELPKRDWDYAIGGDTSEGLPKGDESFAVVREVYSRNVVACLNGLYEPDDFAFKVWLLHRLYNNCLTGVENNNHGYTVNLQLDKLGTNMYHTDTLGSQKRGFSTTMQSRPLILDQAEQDIRLVSCEVRDSDILSQMRTFVKNKKGKPEADGSFLDDGVMSFAICGEVLKNVKITAKEAEYQDEPYQYKRKDLMKQKNIGIKFASRR